MSKWFRLKTVDCVAEGPTVDLAQEREQHHGRPDPSAFVEGLGLDELREFALSAIAKNESLLRSGSSLRREVVTLSVDRQRLRDRLVVLQRERHAQQRRAIRAERERGQGPAVPAGPVAQEPARKSGRCGECGRKRGRRSR